MPDTSFLCNFFHHVKISISGKSFIFGIETESSERESSDLNDKKSIIYKYVSDLAGLSMEDM